MKKTPMNNLEIDVYYEKLDNGLEIYVVEKPNIKNIYATFTTKFGSNINEFVPACENKMIKVPDGVAHFLEHKMFEQEDDIDPFTFFSERGADANANTNNYKTTYLFSGPNFFEENMNFLLDYVQKPYFTDENVEKEKGIIEQEIKMYLDDPYTQIYERGLYNSFKVIPDKIPIIGSIESIKKITKEDLYKCYNTFYHPSNMFVVVVGNVIAKEVINIIKENQSKKEFKKNSKIETKKYKEPVVVCTKKEEIKLDVSIPKVSLNYKLDIGKIKKISNRIIKLYLLLFFDIKFGATSKLIAKLKSDKIISENIGINFIDTNNYILFMLMGESKKPDDLVKLLEEELNDKTIDENEFERKKKVLISSIIYASDNIFSINNKIMTQVVKYGEIAYDEYNDIKNLNVKELNEILNNINFKNNNVVIINSK